MAFFLLQSESPITSHSLTCSGGWNMEHGWMEHGTLEHGTFIT